MMLGRMIDRWRILPLAFSYVFLVKSVEPPLAAQIASQPSLVVNVEQGNGVKHRIGHPMATPLRVSVRDEAERSVAGAEVTFELPDNEKEPGGTFAGGKRTLAVTSDQTGAAVVTPGVQGNNVPGEFKIQVRASHRDSQGTERTGRATFLHSNAIEISKLGLKILQGSQARNNAKSGKAVEPQVLVQDEQAEAVVGAEVVFSLPSSGPSGTFKGGGRSFRTTTGEDGKATGTGFRAQKPCGKLEIEVRASLAGVEADRIRIAQENKGCGPPTAAVIAIVALAGGGGAGAAMALSAKKDGKNGPTPPPIATIQPGAPVFGPPR